MLLAGAAAVRGQSALDGFNPNANGLVNTVVVQLDGRTLASGFFIGIGGQMHRRIARLDVFQYQGGQI